MPRLTDDQSLFCYMLRIKSKTYQEIARQFALQLPNVPVLHRNTVRRLDLKMEDHKVLTNRHRENSPTDTVTTLADIVTKEVTTTFCESTSLWMDDPQKPLRAISTDDDTTHSPIRAVLTDHQIKTPLYTVP